MRRRVLHKIKENIPNTFIGGIAKTGGAGVNEPIDTSLKLATKLGIDQSRIKYFKVIGDDVECNISGSYSVTAFGAMDAINANQNITYYHDIDGLVTGLSTYCFRRCANFNDFTFSENLINIGNSAFAYTSIVTADLSYLQSTTIPAGYNTFLNVTTLITVDTGYLGNSSSMAYSLFRGCSNLLNINIKMLVYGENFRDAGAINSDFYNSYVLSCNSRTFDGARFKKIEMPNCTFLAAGCFYGIGSTRYLKEVIAPKVESIGTITEASTFRGQNILELVDIRACKYFYRPISDGANSYNFRDACKSGSIVKVHEFMSTSNAGNPDEELTYIKDIRGGIVEFYDDNGDYVSTL